ncbi:MAG: hypothetical protein ACK2UH_04155, partial [Candidatus Promineifilaceae bacterium]
MNEDSAPKVLLIYANSKRCFSIIIRQGPCRPGRDRAQRWGGGLPLSAAMYVVDSVAENDGETPHSVTVKDLPVDAF